GAELLVGNAPRHDLRVGERLCLAPHALIADDVTLVAQRDLEVAAAADNRNVLDQHGISELYVEAPVLALGVLASFDGSVGAAEDRLAESERCLQLTWDVERAKKLVRVRSGLVCAHEFRRERRFPQLRFVGSPDSAAFAGEFDHLRAAA